MQLSLDILGKSNRLTKRRRGETLLEYLSRLTHVSVTGAGLTTIDNLASLPQLTSLSLSDNLISRMIGLVSCNKITHLYLQRNNITRIDNIGACRHLKKLHLGYNAIEVLEGLDQVSNLRELHIENQTLHPGAALIFDPRSLAAIADSLNVLNILGNGLENLDDISCFQNLTQLDVSRNALNSLSDVLGAVSRNSSLSNLCVLDNPFCSIPKYREEVIVSSLSLESLDGKEVSDRYRQFLQQFKAVIETRRANSGVAVQLGRRPHHLHRVSKSQGGTAVQVSSLYKFSSTEDNSRAGMSLHSRSTQQFTPSVKLKMRPKHVVLPPIEQSYNTSATSQLLSLNSVQIAAVPVSIRVAALQ